MQTDAIRLNNPHVMTHGTLEVGNLQKSVHFYREFLGIGFAQHAPIAGTIFHGGEWRIAVVQAKQSMLHPQGRENRWVLSMATADEVDEARKAAFARKDEFEIGEITDLETDESGRRFFLLEDHDQNWWEFRFVDGGANGWMDDAFARGDVV